MVVRMTNSKSFGKETENSGPKLATLIQHFLHAKQAEGMSPATVRFYADQLGAFEKRVRVHPRETLLGDLNPTTVREFLVEEEARGMSPATVHARVRALKARVGTAGISCHLPTSSGAFPRDLANPPYAGIASH